MLCLHPTRSWSVSGGTPTSGKFYFGGDTGYRSVPKGFPREEEHLLPHCPAFTEIGARLGPFDLGLIPIGACVDHMRSTLLHSALHCSDGLYSTLLHSALHCFY